MSTWDDKPNEYDHAVRIIELAKQMREAQRRYFRTRTRTDLVVAKNLEVEFDEKAGVL